MDDVLEDVVETINGDGSGSGRGEPVVFSSAGKSNQWRGLTVELAIDAAPSQFTTGEGVARTTRDWLATPAVVCVASHQYNGDGSARPMITVFQNRLAIVVGIHLI